MRPQEKQMAPTPPATAPVLTRHCAVGARPRPSMGNAFCALSASISHEVPEFSAPLQRRPKPRSRAAPPLPNPKPRANRVTLSCQSIMPSLSRSTKKSQESEKSGGGHDNLCTCAFSRRIIKAGMPSKSLAAARSACVRDSANLVTGRRQLLGVPYSGHHECPAATRACWSTRWN